MTVPRNGGRPKEGDRDQLVLTTDKAVRIAKRQLSVVDKVLAVAAAAGEPDPNGTPFDDKPDKLEALKLQIAALNAGTQALTAVMQQLYQLEKTRMDALGLVLRSKHLAQRISQATLDQAVRTLGRQNRQPQYIEGKVEK